MDVMSEEGVEVTVVCLWARPIEVHAGGEDPGEEPSAAQTVGPLPRRHRSDQLEIRGGAAEGVSHEGEEDYSTPQ